MAELEIKPGSATRSRVYGLLAAAAVLTFTLCWLLAGGGSELFVLKITLTTYLPDATGLDVGADVRLNGIPIGTVQSVEISHYLDPPRAVRVVMQIREQYLKSIPANSETVIDEDTIVGYRFVSIVPGDSPLPVAANAVLRGQTAKQQGVQANLLAALERNLAEVDNALAVLSSPGNKVGQVLLSSQQYDSAVARIAGFDRSMNAFLAPRSQFGRALFSAEGYIYIHNMAVRLDNQIRTIQDGRGTAGRLVVSDAQYNQLLSQLQSLHGALASIASGQGRFANLFESDAEYRKIADLLRSTDDLLYSLSNRDTRIGELLANPNLYETLVGSLQSLDGFLTDFLARPSKYMRGKVF